MIYLNQAGTSWPKPEAVRVAVAEALAAEPAGWADQLEKQHADVCRYFGIEDHSRLLLTPGATSALSVAVGDHPWEPGDRIVISGLEHHALHRPAQLLIERGVHVTVVPATKCGPVDLDFLEAELGKGRVRLVAMTAASNVTGDLLPVREILALARKHGALALIDAAQIAGWVPVDVGKLAVDLLVFTGHKGPQGPWGVGGLYVAPHVKMTSPSAACEIPSQGETVPCSPMPGFCDVGSVDRAALAGLAAGLEWLRSPLRENRLNKARHQVSSLAKTVGEIPGVTLHGFAGADSRMPTLALTVKGQDAGSLAAELASRGVIASGGLQCAPLAHETLGTAPSGVLRFSFGPANEDRHVDVAIAVLRDCIQAPTRQFGNQFLSRTPFHA